jgi:hypothetical protein
MLGLPVRKKAAEAVPGTSWSEAVTVMEDGTALDEDGAVYRPLWLIEPADEVAGETDHVTFGYWMAPLYAWNWTEPPNDTDTGWAGLTVRGSAAVFFPGITPDPPQPRAAIRIIRGRKWHEFLSGISSPPVCYRRW